MDFCSIAVSILHSRPVLLRGINSCQTEGLVIAGDMEGASVQCVGEKTLDKVSFFLIQACVGVCQAHTPGSRAVLGRKKTFLSGIYQMLSDFVRINLEKG